MRKVQFQCAGCQEPIARWNYIYECARCGVIVHRRCIRFHREHPGKTNIYSPIQRHHAEADLAKKGKRP